MKIGLTVPGFDVSDFGRVLASLSEAGLQAEVQANAMVFDVARTRAAIEAGVFDVARFEADLQNNPLDVESQRSRWMARCEAVFRVAETAACTRPASDPHGRSMVVHFDLPDDFKGVMKTFCERTAEQAASWSRILGQPFNTSPMPLQTFTRAMHMASMLNLHETLDVLAKACPEAVTTAVPEIAMNEFTFGATRSDGKSIRTTPLFTALQFSSDACVSVLIKHKAHEKPLYEIRTAFPNSEACRSLLTSFGDIQHVGKPETMVPILLASTEKAKKEASGHLKEVLKGIVEFSPGSESLKNLYLLPACLEAGWAHLGPMHSLITALNNNHPRTVKALQGSIEWDKVEMFALSFFSGGPTVLPLTEGKPAAVIALADVAKAEGQGKAMVDSFLFNQRMAKNTAHALLKEESIDLLPKLLGLGLDPKTEVVDAKVTLVDMAKNENPAAYNIFRSFMARQTAHALFEEIDAPLHCAKP